MKRFATLISLLVAISACGDDDTTITTQPAGGTTAATTAAISTTVSDGTTAPTEAASNDCLEIWPESLVQNLTGQQFAFLGANDDTSACTYFAAVSGVGLGWRPDDGAGFESGRAALEAAGEVSDAAGVCDGAFYTATDGVIFLMEAYAAAQGRVYAATITGISLDQSLPWAEALLNAAC